MGLPVDDKAFNRFTQSLHIILLIVIVIIIIIIRKPNVCGGTNPTALLSSLLLTTLLLALLAATHFSLLPLLLATFRATDLAAACFLSDQPNKPSSQKFMGALTK